MIYREDEALPLLEKASQSSQIGTDAHLELSVLYERRHRLDEALDQVQQFLHDDPSNPEATLLKARIHRRAGDTTQAAQIYEELSTRNGCLPNTKAEAINEWANLLDSQHDYPAALEKLLESKQILIGLPETETAKKRSEQEHVWLHHLTDSVTPAHFENWSERESPNTPESVLLTGCPRSGTTLIEKNPSTTFLIPAYQKLQPENRILYALRDPRDIAISCFFRWLPVNTISVRYQTLEDTCRRTAEELDAWIKLREMLPENSWHETRYEDTVADYAKESKKILEWMGLPWDDSISNYRSHMEKRGVNSPTYAAVTQPIYTGALERWKHYEEYLTPHMPILKPCMQALGY